MRPSHHVMPSMLSLPSPPIRLRSSAALGSICQAAFPPRNVRRIPPSEAAQSNMPHSDTSRRDCDVDARAPNGTNPQLVHHASHEWCHRGLLAWLPLTLVQNLAGLIHAPIKEVLMETPPPAFPRLVQRSLPHREVNHPLGRHLDGDQHIRWCPRGCEARLCNLIRPVPRGAGPRVGDVLRQAHPTRDQQQAHKFPIAHVRA
jgi:hypothetical protein